MRRITLTDGQAELLEKLLEREMDEEWLYQMDGFRDPAHYKDVLGLYKAIQRKPRNLIEAFAIKGLTSDRDRDLAEIVGGQAKCS